jgi:hypothetical protein
LIEGFLRWNPTGFEKEIVDAVLKYDNWFLVGTIAQFCFFAFVFICINSLEELILRLKEFWENIRKKRGQR